jgi:hypothetical protein
MEDRLGLALVHWPLIVLTQASIWVAGEIL